MHLCNNTEYSVFFLSQYIASVSNFPLLYYILPHHVCNINCHKCNTVYKCIRRLTKYVLALVQVCTWSTLFAY